MPPVDEHFIMCSVEHKAAETADIIIKHAMETNMLHCIAVTHGKVNLEIPMRLLALGATSAVYTNTEGPKPTIEVKWDKFPTKLPTWSAARMVKQIVFSDGTSQFVGSTTGDENSPIPGVDVQ